MKDEIIAAVAQGWCTKENENKTMDSTLAMAIVDNVMVVIEKLEKQESDYRKIIYEVLGCKPIPACERDDDKLEPPWEVVKRIRLKNEKLEAVADAALKVTNECLVSDAEVKDIEKCCYCGHPVTVEGFYDAESGEEWEKVTPIETENEELKQRVKKLEARLADAGTIQTEYCESIDYIEKLEVRIEELISAKGIKELEARLADAEREACAKIADGDKQCEKANCTEQHYCREAIAAAIRKRGCGEKETLKDTNDERNDNAK